MTLGRVSATALLLMVILWPSSSRAAQQIELPVGQQVFLSVRGMIERLAIAEPAIADANPVGTSQVRVLGVTPGRTELSIWVDGQKGRHDYVVTVIHDISGLRDALKQYPETAHLRVEAEPGGQVRVTGRLATLADHAKAMAVVQAHAPDGFVDLTTVGGTRTVSVDIKFAALSMNSLKAIGFDLGIFGESLFAAVVGPRSVSGFSFDAASGFSLESAVPVNDAFSVFLGSGKADFMTILGILSKSDLAQMLAEPTLVVRSGESASFLAGGEIPIPVPQGQSGVVTIDWKKFGIRLDVAATVLADDRIVLKVEPEVSELDFGNALTLQGTTVPALRTRSTTTTVELGDGESLVLAGLTFDTNGAIDERIPGIGALPVIGALFKRTRNVRERQELVIIATPHLIAPMEKGYRPTLPGEVVRDYAPTVPDMLLDRNTVPEAMIRFGLVE